MSYDILLIRPRPDESPADAAFRDDKGDGVLTPPQVARNGRAVAALRALDPALHVDESPSGVVLTDISSGSGIQVSLHADSGAVSIPYWHGRVGEHVELVRRFLTVLGETTDFVCFDPQTERVLDVANDHAFDTSTYTQGVATLNRALDLKPQRIPIVAAGTWLGMTCGVALAYLTLNLVPSSIWPWWLVSGMPIGALCGWGSAKALLRSRSRSKDPNTK